MATQHLVWRNRLQAVTMIGMIAVKFAQTRNTAAVLWLSIRFDLETDLQQFVYLLLIGHVLLLSL